VLKVFAYKSLIQNHRDRFHALAMRRAKSWIEAMNSHAIADAMVCSKSLARRRLLPSHAKVRSTTQRLVVRGLVVQTFSYVWLKHCL